MNSIKKWVGKFRSWNLLRDLNGELFPFFHGGEDTVTDNRIYYTNSIDVAADFSLDDNIIKCYIRVKNPFVIDAFSNGQFFSYDYIKIKECSSSSAQTKCELQTCFQGDTVDADSIADWVQENTDHDAVIIKNVREGCFSGLPVYDVIVWNQKNCVKREQFKANAASLEPFKTYANKRVDLSQYISEKEKDGICGMDKHGKYEFVFFIGEKSVDKTLRIHTEKPVKIEAEILFTCSEMNHAGIYRYAADMGDKDRFYPDCGIVDIHGFPEFLKDFSIKAIEERL